MKTPLLFGLLLLISLNLTAQDPRLPTGRARINLKSGKAFQDVRLWEIDIMRVKFVRQGNLDEILTSDVENIETEKYFIRFDKNKQYFLVPRDYIISIDGDTIFGSIDEINLYYIYYVNPFSVSRKSISIKKTKSYVWNDESIHQSTIIDTVKTSIVHENIIEKSNTNDLIQPAIQSYSDKNAEYYYESYNKGVEDAKAVSTTGMAVSGFLISFIFGSHYLVSGAMNEKEPSEIPAGVEPRLYAEGYKKTLAIKKGKSAANGASVGKTIVLVIIFGSIMSAF